uniref:Class I hydrophobin POH2 n=1 Tax=Pleurotus ostreatus TaxID=5322 RepID=POH2_PLEOS|nr:POH2 hydrophobin [Pleurotus ostreatus]CAA74987.1 hydrophobin [Pleurotus ostreatus]
MFFRTSSLFTTIVAFTVMAAAMPGNPKPTTTTVTVTAPAHPTATAPASECKTGPVQCCNSVQSSKSPAASLLLGLLGIVLQGVAVPVGLTCNPITVIGVGGNSCSAQTVCCENNNFSGLIAIGCTPINLSL